MSLPLPKIDIPTYEVILPSTGKEITIRPFLVKEEKLLLMAAESGDTEEIVRTTKQIVNNCILSEGVNVDKLPFFDIDYLFIALRAKSIGESVEMQFTCNAVNDEGKKCGHVFDADVDISNVAIVKNKEIKNKIDIGNGSFVKMKYPTYAVMKDIKDEQSLLENKLYVITNCIDQIVQGDNVYSSKDYTKEELKEFVEGLTESSYKKMELFVDNFPYFYVSIKKKCPKCKFEHNLRYTDFQNFFY